MIDAFAGKKYVWGGGADFGWGATTTWEWVVKSTGLTLKDNGQAGPTDESLTDWILSDDLFEIGAKTASLRIKCSKTAGASYTVTECDINGFAAYNTEELTASVYPAAGATHLWMSSNGNPGSGSITIPVTMMAGASGTTRYQHVHFYSSPAGRIIQPIRWIAVTLPLQSGGASPSRHTWKFEVQWYYTR